MADFNIAPDPFMSRLTNTQATLVRAKSGASAADMQKIDEAAQEFESVFIAEMLRPMFETVESDEMFGGGRAEETWRGLLIDEYGKGITKAGGIGLADHVKAAMIQMQSQREGQ